MAFDAWPDREIQDANFMGIEPQHPWLAFLAPSVPDAASVFSASPRMLSEASWSHECLPVGSASSPSSAGAREQPASLMDLDLWVEPPVAPLSASVPHSFTAPHSHHSWRQWACSRGSPCLCEPQHTQNHLQTTKHDARLHSEAQRRPEHASIHSIRHIRAQKL